MVMAAIASQTNADTSARAVRVALCVCTRGRPRMAKRCFESLRAQTGAASDLAIEIIVVDNDPAQTAQAAFDDVFGADARARYVVCATAGIPFARNAALDAALAGDADYVAFIDDDEIAPLGWLDSLMTAMLAASADVVQGGVRKVGPDFDLDTEMRRAPDRNAPIETVETVATCNVLFKSWLAKPPVELRFDEAMRFTGGSDRDYFMRATQAGAKVVKSKGAHVIEEIAQGRDSFGYECMRAFAAGNNYTLRMTKNEHPLRATARIGLRTLDRAVMGSVKMIAGGLWLAAFQRKRAAKQFKKGGANLSFAGGCVCALFGLRAQPYRVIQGA